MRQKKKNKQRKERSQEDIYIDDLCRLTVDAVTHSVPDWAFADCVTEIALDEDIEQLLLFGRPPQDATNVLVSTSEEGVAGDEETRLHVARVPSARGAQRGGLCVGSIEMTDSIYSVDEADEINLVAGESCTNDFALLLGDSSAAGAAQTASQTTEYPQQHEEALLLTTRYLSAAYQAYLAKVVAITAATVVIDGRLLDEEQNKAMAEAEFAAAENLAHVRAMSERRRKRQQQESRGSQGSRGSSSLSIMRSELQSADDPNVGSESRGGRFWGAIMFPDSSGEWPTLSLRLTAVCAN